MYFTKIFLSTLALAASHASALGTLSENLGSLVSRQVTSNNQCEATCLVFQNSLDSCTDITCLCSLSVATTLQNCVNCAVAANSTSQVIDSANSLATYYSGTCAPLGIPAITVPSGSSSTSRIGSTSSSRAATLTSVSSDGSFSILPFSSTSSTGNDPQSTISQNIPFPSTISQIIIRPSDTESSSPSSSATGDDSVTPTSMGSRNGVTMTLLAIFSAGLGAWLVL